MSLEDWKASLSQLSPGQRQELIEFLQALNIVSGHAAPGAHPPAAGRAAAAKPAGAAPVWQGPALVIAIILLLAAGIGWAIGTWNKEQLIQERALAIKERSLAEESEARRPHSPTNIAFLNQSIGREITVRGVPRDSEVGALYFHRDHAQGLMVDIFEPHVVLYQSGQLEEWVRNGTELEIFGLLEADPKTGRPMIDIKQQNQIKVVKPD